MEQKEVRKEKTEILGQGLGVWDSSSGFGTSSGAGTSNGDGTSNGAGTRNGAGTIGIPLQ